MKVEYTGKEKIKETQYFNREISPGWISEIKEEAGKVLIRSRVWKKWEKPKEEPKKEPKKEGSK